MNMEKNPRNLNKNDLKRAIESKDADSLIDSLSEEERKTLNYFMNNKAAREKLLGSDDAKALFKMLMGR